MASPYEPIHGRNGHTRAASPSPAFSIFRRWGLPTEAVCSLPRSRQFQQ